MPVYFIRNERTGSYKIGISDDPGTRLRELQTANEDRLSLACVLYHADDQLERDLHQRWARLRIRGEWFLADAEIDDYVTAHQLRQLAWEHNGASGLETLNWFQERSKEDPIYQTWFDLWAKAIVGNIIRGSPN